MEYPHLSKRANDIFDKFNFEWGCDWENWIIQNTDFPNMTNDEKITAVLDGCYFNIQETYDFPYNSFLYYFFPEALDKDEKSIWEESECHVNHEFTKKQLIDAVYNFAINNDIKITKKAINEKYTQHNWINKSPSEYL